MYKYKLTGNKIRCEPQHVNNKHNASSLIRTLSFWDKNKFEQATIAVDLMTQGVRSWASEHKLALRTATEVAVMRKNNRRH